MAHKDGSLTHLEMWPYYRDDCSSPASALERNYAELIASDPALQRYVQQVKDANLLINQRMNELIHEEEARMQAEGTAL